MSRRRQIYEGKAKVLFEGPESGTLVQHFKDDASAGSNHNVAAGSLGAAARHSAGRRAKRLQCAEDVQ